MFSPKASIVPQPLADRKHPDWFTQPSDIDYDWPQRSHTFQTNGQYIEQMAFLPDGRLVSMLKSGKIDIWDPKYGSCLLTIWSNQVRTIHPFSTSRDNKTAVPSSNSIEIWDNSNGTLCQKVIIEDHEVYEVAFTDDYKFICSRSRRLGQEVESDGSSVTGQDSELTSQESEEESVTESEQGIIHIHNVSTGECVREFGCGVPLSTLSFSPKGQWITAEHAMIARWDVYSDLCWVKLESDDKHTAWGFSVDGTLLASTTFHLGARFDEQWPLEIKVWCTKSNKCLYTLTILDGELTPMNLRDLILTKDLLVYRSIKWEAVFIHLETGQVSRGPDIRVVYSLAVSLDGNTLATQSRFGIIEIWDLASMSLAEPPNFHSSPVERLAPIADGNTIISMTRGEVKIWDISTGHCMATAQQVQYAGRYHSVLSTLATATNAPLYATWSLNEIVIWRFDPVHGIQQLPQKYATAGNQLENVTVSADGERLAVYLYDTSHECFAVQVWDLENASLLQEFNCGYYPGPAWTGPLTLALSHDGARVAYGATLGSIKVHHVSNPQCSTTLTLSYPNNDSLSHLSFDNGRILAITKWIIRSFDDETGEETGQYRLDESDTEDRVSKSFFYIETIHSTNTQVRRPTSDGMNSYYNLTRDRWLQKDGEDIVWLPPEYMPQAICVMGSTVVIGTATGRLLFLYLRDWS